MILVYFAVFRNHRQAGVYSGEWGRVLERGIYSKRKGRIFISLRIQPFLLAPRRWRRFASRNV